MLSNVQIHDFLEANEIVKFIPSLQASSIYKVFMLSNSKSATFHDSCVNNDAFEACLIDITVAKKKFSVPALRYSFTCISGPWNAAKNLLDTELPTFWLKAITVGPQCLFHVFFGFNPF